MPCRDVPCGPCLARRGRSGCAEPSSFSVDRPLLCPLPNFGRTTSTTWSRKSASSRACTSGNSRDCCRTSSSAAGTAFCLRRCLCKSSASGASVHPFPPFRGHSHKRCACGVASLCSGRNERGGGPQIAGNPRFAQSHLRVVNLPNHVTELDVRSMRVSARLCGSLVLLAQSRPIMARSASRCSCFTCSFNRCLLCTHAHTQVLDALRVVVGATLIFDTFDSGAAYALASSASSRLPACRLLDLITMPASVQLLAPPRLRTHPGPGQLQDDLVWQHHHGRRSTLPGPRAGTSYARWSLLCRCCILILVTCPASRLQPRSRSHPHGREARTGLSYGKPAHLSALLIERAVLTARWSC
jgi:hypothetical protein